MKKSFLLTLAALAACTLTATAATLARESYWMRALGSRTHGLNG